MKQIFIVCLLVCMGTSFTLWAQIDSTTLFRSSGPTFHEIAATAIQDALTTDPNDTAEGGEASSLQRWELFMGNRVSNDVAIGENISAPISLAMQTYLQNINTFCTANNADWQCLGPFNVGEAQGRVNSLWVHPSNPDIILAGSDAGGLWKTTDGGANWANITDGTTIPGTMGVVDIAVNPTNMNIIYINLSISGQYKKSVGYHLGIAYSTNGGSSWSADNGLNTLIGGNGMNEMKKIAYMPGTEKLFAIHYGRIFYKADASTAWTELSPSLPTGHYFTDLEFTKQSTGKLLLSTNAYNGSSYIYLYNTATNTWSNYAVTLPSGYTQPNGTNWNDYGIQNFSVAGNDDIFAEIKVQNSSSADKWALMSAPLNTSGFTLINSNFSHFGGNMVEDFEVSPSNSAIIYSAIYSERALSVSTNGGISFATISNGHMDGRSMYLYSTTNTSNGINDVVYYGSDGGVGRKAAGQSNAVSITGTGLAITEFYGLGNTEADEDYISAGAQDQGGFTYIKNRTSKWVNDVGGCDGYTSKFMNNGITKAFGETNGSLPYPLYGMDFSGNTTTGFGIAYPSTDLAISHINRPMQFNSANTGYVGYTRLWELPFTATSWQPAQLNDPVNLSGGAVQPDRVVDFYKDENNPDIAYVAYRDPRAGSFGKLFYTDNANDPTVSWLNISSFGLLNSIIDYDCLNSIAVDPNNSDRIWVALGNINNGEVNTSPANMVYRVLYSSNHGQTWNDVSKGLSALPVNKLLYQKGTDDIIYAGTDVGVFRWNKATQQWDCFNNGMPTCIVMDLEFNYCAGKLRAATFGRGMWETPVVQNTDVVGTATTITSYTNWTSDKYLTGSVLVTSGNTLEITGSTTTIHMAKNSMITVEPGAHLIVTDATITNSCESCMWLGIEATGNATLPQTGSNQGKVTLVNATIEHARNAVMNWGSYSGLGGASCGGIIQASNTLFHNCRRSVAFNQYYYGTIKNASSFVKCNFIIDEGYKGDSNSPFEEQVALYNTNGVKFYGCEFYNRLTNAQKGLGIAIHIAGGGGEVHDESFSGGSPVHCKFTGFKFGVFAEAAAIPNYKTLIDGAVFDSCGIGIRGLNDNSIVATNNNFYVGRGTFAEINNTDCYKNIGIFLTACPNAIVEENTATGVTPGNSQSGFERMGIVVSNSGSSDKDVYRNTLTGLEYGVLALDLNSAGLIGAPSPGLHVLCNSFQSNIRDIYAAVDPSQLAYGLGYFQGSPSISAGNQFLTSTTSPVNINNYAHFIEYFYNGAQPSYAVSSSPSSGIWFQTATANTCPARYGGGGYPNTSTGKAAASSAYFTAAAQKASLESNYAALVDGGDYNLLQAYVDGYTIEDSTTVYDSLSNMSPWLSREILVHVADAGVLPSNMMKDILINNPEMVDLDLIDHVGTGGSIPYPLNSGEQAEVEDAMGTATARSDMNSEIALQASDMRYFTNVMLTNLMIDSMGTEADSIPVWYDRMNTVEAEYNKIGYYVGIGDYTTAENLISNLPNKFSLTTQETNELDLYTQFYDILKNIHNDGRSIMEITEAELADIQSIQDDATTINARQIIIDTKGITEAPNPNAKQICPYLLVLSSEGKQAPEQGQMNAKRNIQRKPARADKVNAYPNPAKDYILFTYNVKKPSGELHITIANEMGKIVADIPLVRKTGTYNLNTDKLPSGLYIYKLFDLNKTVDIGKVVIVK